MIDRYTPSARSSRRPAPVWLLTLALLLVSAEALAQAEWVERAGGTSQEIAYGIATDGAGGSFIAGYFFASMDFDGDGTGELTSAGSGDILIARYDGDGNFLWGRRAGGAGFDIAYAVSSDGEGGAYLAGQFREGADFDGDGTPDVFSAGANDIFLARYDSEGELLWVRDAGGEIFDRAYGVVPDGEGGAFVTGTFIDDADFDGDGVADVSGAGSFDVFVARYDGDGELLWVRSAGSSRDDVSNDIAVDGLGGVVVAGQIRESVDFDGDGAADVVSAGEQDIFAARYDGEGNLVWVRSAGGISTDYGYDVASDGAGGAYVTGYFQINADFDGDGAPDVSSAGDRDIFLAYYDAAGELVWLRRAGSAASDRGEGIDANVAGNIFLVGRFQAGADFDEDGTADVTSLGVNDIFVAEYDAAGTLVKVSQAGGPEDDRAYSVAVDAAGNAFVTGRFVADADFTEDGTPDVSALGFEDAFVARYGDNPVSVAPSPTAGAAGLALYPNPTASEARVLVSVPEAGEATVSVHDALGRRVAVLHDGPLAVGEHSFAFASRTLPSGLYIVRAETAAGAVVQRLSVVR